MQQGTLHLLVCLGVCVLLVCPVSVVSSQSLQYHYISERKSWTDAQSYCRSRFTDLASILSTEDVQRSSEALKNHTERAWIGLNKTWGWSSTTGPKHLSYKNWHSEEPDYSKPAKTCGVMQADGTWVSTDCKNPQPYICYKTNTLFGLIPLPNTYFITRTKLSWSDAQSRCRGSYTDLAILSSTAENFYVQRVLSPDAAAWIGLSRNTWRWSDLNPSTFRYWLNVESSDPGQNCALINPSALFRWEEESCNVTLPFLCYSGDEQTTEGVTGRKQILSLELQSDQDVNDPAVKEEILQKIQQELEDQGMEGNSTLTWRLQPDGSVFQKKKNAAQDEL